MLSDFRISFSRIRQLSKVFSPSLFLAGLFHHQEEVVLEFFSLEHCGLSFPKRLKILIIAGIYKENPTLALRKSSIYTVWKHKFSNITLVFSNPIRIVVPDKEVVKIKYQLPKVNPQ